MESNVLTVTEVNKYIKSIFEKDKIFDGISIRGEVTNFRAHYSGHLYFTLKDERCAINCIMFKGHANYLKFKLENGMKVVLTGKVSVYEASGNYQVYCTKISPEGLGDLYLSYLQLKEKLEKEGLFDDSLKKKIPYLPKRVGVITSKTGSVVRDIINVSVRRFDKVNLLIYPSKVQGSDVGKTVSEGIKTFNRLNNVDIIIVARGGGSFEDLFGFNDELLAREIYNSKIPIVSAVGHETDFTICDFVSDLRAPTPSAAAELVYPNILELYNFVNVFKTRSIKAIEGFINVKKEYIKGLKASKLEKVPLEKIINNRLNLDKTMSLNELKLQSIYDKSKSNYINVITKLDAISPIKTLQRGYSVVTNKNKVVKSIKDVKKEDIINIALTDGSVKAEVKEF